LYIAFDFLAELLGCKPIVMLYFAGAPPLAALLNGAFTFEIYSWIPRLYPMRLREADITFAF
jgi:hypothetical protein